MLTPPEPEGPPYYCYNEDTELYYECPEEEFDNLYGGDPENMNMEDPLNEWYTCFDYEVAPESFLCNRWMYIDTVNINCLGDIFSIVNGSGEFWKLLWKYPKCIAIWFC